MTRDDLIELAFRQGIIGDKESVSTEQLALGADRLNLILKRLVTKEFTYWTISTTQIAYGSFTSNKATITGTPTAKRVINVRRISSDASERVPIDLVSRSDYINWGPYYTTSTAPSQVYAHVKYNTIDVYAWPTMGTYTLELDVEYLNTLPSAGTDVLVIPEHWEEALIYELFCALAPTYGVSIEERQLSEMKRKQLVEEASEYDNEGVSLFIAPSGCHG